MSDSKHSALGFPSREKFIEFVKTISPAADVVSVLLFGHLHRASNHLVHIAEKQLEKTGLTWPQFRLLMHLMRDEQHGQAVGMMPSELSEHQNISRNTASALISSLEEHGYISRELHGTDRRKFLIKLTPKGRKLLQMQLGNHFVFLGQCFNHLTTKERQTLSELLEKLNASLHEKAKTA
jgi:DNA-binding MarR family transcriptional regulator